MAGRGNKNSGSARRPRKEKDEKAWQKKGKRKFCIFCKDRIDYVDYKDTVTLRKFTSERGKIRARRVTGNCVQHQRDVAIGRQERPRDGPAPVLVAMKIILQKPVDKLGVPRRHRRGCRRLRAQLPDPAGPGGQGREGDASGTPSRSARAHTSRLSQQKGEYEAIASKLISSGSVTIAARAGEEGKLFGSVTADQIADGGRGFGRGADRQEGRPPRRADPFDRHARGPGPSVPRGRAGHHRRGRGRGLGLAPLHEHRGPGLRPRPSVLLGWSTGMVGGRRALLADKIRVRTGA